MALVKLTSCANSFEAELLRGQLTDIGVESILQGENFNQTYGPMSFTDIQVLVDEKGYEKAHQVLPVEETTEEPTREPYSWLKAVRYGLLAMLIYCAVVMVFNLIFALSVPDSELAVAAVVFGFFATLIRWWERNHLKKKSE